MTFVDLGQTFADLGQTFADLGQTFVDLGQTFVDPGFLRESIMIGRSLVLKERTFYFPMIWDSGVGGCYVDTAN